MSTANEAWSDLDHGWWPRLCQQASIAVCPLTSEPIEAPILRIQVEPTPENGLRATSRLMVDKVTTVPKSRLGQCIGRLADDDLLRPNRSLLVFLRLAR